MDIEIEITRDGDLLHVIARGSQGERPLPHNLGPEVGQARLDTFTARVGRVVQRGGPVCDLPLDDARALHAALFRDDLKTVLDRALDPSRPDAAKGGPPLVRLFVREAALQSVPWEALCEPRSAEKLLGASQQLRFARGVASKDPFQAREVRGAVRLLAIAPTAAEPALAPLRAALDEPIRAGELEWLPPITGARASRRHLFDSIRAAASPHVLHFLGHGGLDPNARPVLRIGDEDGDDEEKWVTVELLGQELAPLFRGDLRLVHLEACEGAAPGAFGSAAEILCRAGADAVVAHLWPVRAPAARACARDFYRALTAGSSAAKGDVVASLGAARRTLLLSSAEGLSPVVYLRGPGSLVFDLAKRRLKPTPAEPERPAPGDLDPALTRLLQRPFSLVLGDGGQDQLAGRDQLRRQLAGKLAEADHRHGAAIPSLSAVAQRFELCFGQAPLRQLFGRAFRQMLTTGDLDVPRGIDALARLLGPGVHATLLWVPLLESAIARRHPDRAVYVLTPPGPSDHEISVTIRPAGSEEWIMATSLPDANTLDEAFLVLRLYGGYPPGDAPELTSLFVTEDDYIQGLRRVEQGLPPDWVEEMRKRLYYRPALFTGMSALKWRHRMLLQWLFGERPAPKDSIALLAANGGDDERQVWTKRGGGLPGSGSVATVTASRDDLAPLLDSLDPAAPA